MNKIFCVKVNNAGLGLEVYHYVNESGTFSLTRTGRWRNGGWVDKGWVLHRYGSDIVFETRELAEERICKVLEGYIFRN